MRESDNRLLSLGKVTDHTIKLAQRGQFGLFRACSLVFLCLFWKLISLYRISSGTSKFMVWHHHELLYFAYYRCLQLQQ